MHPLNFTFIRMRKLVANYARASRKHPSHEMRPRYANRRRQCCTDITFLSPTSSQHPHRNLRTSDVACSQLCHNQVSSWVSLLSTLVNLCLAHYSSEHSRSWLSPFVLKFHGTAHFPSHGHLRKVSKPYLSAFPISWQKRTLKQTNYRRGYITVGPLMYDVVKCYMQKTMRTVTCAQRDILV